MALLLYAGEVLVALTGGIGSGKSTVADLFAKHGAVVFHADELAREVVANGGSAHTAVVAHFGEKILDASGKLDRSKLAEIVFNDPTELKILELITHPAIQLELANRVKELPPQTVVIYEIPLLIEKMLFEKFDKSIAVISELELRRNRAIDRGLTAEDFENRIRFQTNDSEREKLVDIVIYNNGNMTELAKQVDQAWLQLTA
jgi:dephospho-CoA kinase